MPELLPRDFGSQVTKPVQASISPAEIASPYALLAEGLKKTGEAADEVASSYADQAGLKAVTMDENGNPQVERAFMMGPAAKHYADAVKFGALAQGEGAARRKDIELRQQFRDNPEGYNQAATEFAQTMQDQYTKAAGPLVGISMRKAIEQQTTLTYKGLLNEKERLDLYRAQDSMQSELYNAKNYLGSLVENGVTEGKEWDAANQKIDSIYQQMENNPRLAWTPQRTATEKSAFLGELDARSIGYHVLQIASDPGPNGGYENALKAAGQIKTDSSLNLTPAQRDTYYNRAISQLNAKLRQDQVSYKDVETDIKQAAIGAAKGFLPTPESLGKTQAKINAIADPAVKAQLDNNFKAIVGVANTMADYQKANPRQLAEALDQNREIMRQKGADPLSVQVDQTGRQLLKTEQTELGKDPWAWSNRVGAVVSQPIDFAAPDAVDRIAKRVGESDVMSQHYEIPTTYWHESEKTALSALSSKGGPGMLAVAKMIAAGGGERAPQMLEELGKEAPALAHLGALNLHGGNEQFANDVVAAIQNRQNPEYMKTVAPEWRTIGDVAYAAQSSRVREVYGTAFALMPDMGRGAQSTAADAFFTRGISLGLDPKLGGELRRMTGLAGGDKSEQVFDRTLQQAAGATYDTKGVQYGGVGKYAAGRTWYGAQTSQMVAVPPNVRADRFKDVIGAITDGDLSLMAVSPAARAVDLHNATPVKVKGGYAFVMGEITSDNPKVIYNVLDKPFVLDFNQLEDKLRKRVPNAFLNQR